MKIKLSTIQKNSRRVKLFRIGTIAIFVANLAVFCKKTVGCFIGSFLTGPSVLLQILFFWYQVDERRNEYLETFVIFFQYWFLQGWRIFADLEFQSQL